MKLSTSYEQKLTNDASPPGSGEYRSVSSVLQDVHDFFGQPAVSGDSKRFKNGIFSELPRSQETTQIMRDETEVHLGRSRGVLGYRDPFPPNDEVSLALETSTRLQASLDHLIEEKNVSDARFSNMLEKHGEERERWSREMSGLLSKFVDVTQLASERSQELTRANDHLTDLRRELSKRDETTHNLQNALEEARSILEQQRLEIDGLRLGTTQMAEQITAERSSWEQDRDNLGRQKSATEQQLSLLRTELTSQRSRAAALEEMISQLNLEKARELAQINNELLNFQTELQAKDRQIGDQQHALEETKSVLAQRRAEIEDLHLDAKEMADRVNAERAAWLETKKSLIQQQEDTQLQLDLLQKELFAKKNHAAELEEQNIRLEVEHDRERIKANSDLNEARAELVIQKNHVEELQSTLEEMRGILAQRTVEVDRLHRTSEEMTAQFDAERSKLMEAKGLLIEESIKTQQQLHFHRNELATAAAKADGLQHQLKIAHEAIDKKNLEVGDLHYEVQSITRRLNTERTVWTQSENRLLGRKEELEREITSSRDELNRVLLALIADNDMWARFDFRKYARVTRLIQRSGLFDEAAYLDAHPDVAQAKVNPLNHYLEYGLHEGRLRKKPTSDTDRWDK